MKGLSQILNSETGTIANATCSQAEDAARIFAEIGDKTDAVDYAIHVLLSAGMSSHTLRDVARAGINIHGAGHAEIAVPCVAFVPNTLLTLFQMCFDVFYLQTFWCFRLFQLVSVLARLALFILLWHSPTDERCFILKTMTKLLAVYLVIACPLLAIWEIHADAGVPTGIHSFSREWFAVPMAIYTTILGLACLLAAFLLKLSNWVGALKY